MRRPVFDTDGAAAFDEDAGGVGVGRDRQIAAAARRPQIGPRRAPAAAVGRRRLVIADPFLARPVEVVIGRDAGFDRGLYHRVAERRAHRVRDVQRPALAMKRVGAAFLVLGLLEERQHPIPVPALAAALPPAVVIGRGAAHVDHAVDRAGAAQDLAARLVEGAVVELLFGLAFEHPVVARVGESLGVAERDVDPRVAVAPPGFEQQHAPAPVLAEPAGDGAARRTGAGDDEVETLLGRRDHRFPEPPPAFSNRSTIAPILSISTPLAAEGGGRAAGPAGGGPHRAPHR